MVTSTVALSRVGSAYLSLKVRTLTVEYIERI